MNRIKIIYSVLGLILLVISTGYGQIGRYPADLSGFRLSTNGYVTSGAGPNLDIGYDIEPDVTGNYVYVNQGYRIVKFDLSGKVVSIGPSSSVTNQTFVKIAIDSNNNVYGIANELGRAVIAKFRPDLTPDLSFGSNGRVILNFAPNIFINDIGVESNSIVVVGHFNSNPNINKIIEPDKKSQLFLARYTLTGFPVLGFGSGNGFLFESFGTSFGAESLAFRGHEIVVGGTGCNDIVYASCGSTITVYDQGGRRLSAFNNGKTRWIGPNQNQTKVGVQSTGKIIFSTNGTYAKLFRLTANGSLDSGFNGNFGLTGANPNYFFYLQEFKIDPLDKINTTGIWYDVYQGGGPIQPLVARFDPNGNPDPTFYSTLPQISTGSVLLNFDGNNRQFSGGIAVFNQYIYVSGHSGDAAPRVAWLGRLNGIKR